MTRLEKQALKAQAALDLSRRKRARGQRQRSPLKREMVRKHAPYLAGLLDGCGYARWRTNGQCSTIRCAIEVHLKSYSDQAQLDKIIEMFGGYKTKNPAQSRWLVYGLDAKFLYDSTAAFRFRGLNPQEDRMPGWRRGVPMARWKKPATE